MLSLFFIAKVFMTILMYIIFYNNIFSMYLRKFSQWVTFSWQFLCEHIADQILILKRLHNIILFEVWVISKFMLMISHNTNNGPIDIYLRLNFRFQVGFISFQVKMTLKIICHRFRKSLSLFVSCLRCSIPHGICVWK